MAALTIILFIVGAIATVGGIAHDDSREVPE